ncbi:hypothetical protein Tco_0878408 [Tanacetum coccineum]|uniref:Uncharacterized protein n=1 Tax=Tanacetum coccineum TaxID=301880 RepID=A0ABQ5C095_9ASTR
MRLKNNTTSGTDSTKVSIDRQGEGTADQNKGKSATQTAPTTTSTPTPTMFGDDETIAQVLITMSQNKQKEKEKEKGVEIRNVEDTERPRPTSTRSILTLRPIPKIDTKDKGKKRIEEEDKSDTESEGITEAEKKFKKLANDEEMARKVQEEWEAEDEKKRLAEEEATKVALTNEYDFIQARINADKILAEELQKEEREKFTIEQRAKFLHDTIAAQRKFLAQQRSEDIRNKPLIRNQLRNQMMTYLKHVGGKKNSKLKTKTFKEIQVLYERLKRQDQNFVAIGSAEDERQIKEMNEESKDPKKKRLKKRVVNEEDIAKVPAKQEAIEQGTKKRKSGHVKMIARKRPRPQPNDDSDDEHRKCLRIVTFEGTIDSEIIETKSFIARLHKVSSPDGKFSPCYHYSVNVTLGIFNLYNRRDIELILWADLKIMMESSIEENDQEGILSPDLYATMFELGMKVKEDKVLCNTIELAIPEEMATGKGISNSLMAGSLRKTTKLTYAATLAKAYSQIYNGKSRHLGVRHNMVRELITNGVISVDFVRSQQNLADHLTKGLARDLVHKSAIGMGLKCKTKRTTYVSMECRRFKKLGLGFLYAHEGYGHKAL